MNKLVSVLVDESRAMEGKTNYTIDNIHHLASNLEETRDSISVSFFNGDRAIHARYPQKSRKFRPIETPGEYFPRAGRPKISDIEWWMVEMDNFLEREAVRLTPEDKAFVMVLGSEPRVDMPLNHLREAVIEMGRDGWRLLTVTDRDLSNMAHYLVTRYSAMIKIQDWYVDWYRLADSNIWGDFI